LPPMLDALPTHYVSSMTVTKTNSVNCRVTVEHGRVDRVGRITIVIHVWLVPSVSALVTERLLVGPDEIPVRSKQVRLSQTPSAWPFGCV